MTTPNQGAAANRCPAWAVGGSGNLSATVAADRAFPAAVAELRLGRLMKTTLLALAFTITAAFAQTADYSKTPKTSLHQSQMLWRKLSSRT